MFSGCRKGRAQGYQGIFLAVFVVFRSMGINMGKGDNMRHIMAHVGNVYVERFVGYQVCTTVMICVCEFVCNRWFCQLQYKHAIKIGTGIEIEVLAKCVGAHVICCFGAMPCPGFLVSLVANVVAHRRCRRRRRRRGRWRCGGVSGGGPAVSGTVAGGPAAVAGAVRPAVALSRGSGRPRRRLPAASAAGGISTATPRPASFFC